MTRVLTWNIGSTFSVQWAKYLGIVYKGQKIKHQYFQPILNGKFVSDKIKKLNPDILFLQEIHDPEDIKSIPVLKEYPYQKLFHTQDQEYLDHQMLIASKYPFSEDRQETTSVFEIDGTKYVPVHLDAFSPKQRLITIQCLVQRIRSVGKVILLGDTNFWQRKGWCMWDYDSKAYNTISGVLVDVSKKVPSTSITSFSPDKVFTSSDIAITHIDSPRIRGSLMDHYPIVFEI